MTQEDSPESKAFRKCYGLLFENIDSPKPLAMWLYSCELLTKATRKKISSLDSQSAMDVLLDAVEGQIKTDPQNFYKFLEQLGKDKSMQNLCGKLKDTCGE